MPHYGARDASLWGSTGNRSLAKFRHPIYGAVPTPPSDLVASAFGALLSSITENVDQAVRLAVQRELPKAIRTANRPEYMTRAEAAEYAGRSVRSLDHLRSSGKLAWAKRGGRVVIKTDDLDAYLGDGYVPTRGQGERGL